MKLETIDTSTTAGKAEVMRLAAEGRRVASRIRGTSRNAMRQNDTPLWDWMNIDYAIIAEPVGHDEVWIVLSKGGSVCAYSAARLAGAVRYVRADD